MITHCPMCSKAYEESSEEMANSPDRRCRSCWTIGREVPCPLCSRKVAIVPIEAGPLVPVLDKHDIPRPADGSPARMVDTWEKLTVVCPMSGAVVRFRGERE